MHTVSCICDIVHVCCLCILPVPATIAYKWWNCQTGHPDLHIVVNTFLQTVSSTVFWIRVSLHGYASCSQELYTRTLMSGVCSQCHGSWGEIFMQSLFWMGTFEVFWSSIRSRVQTNYGLGMQPLKVSHLLYRNLNRYQHQFQHKLSMEINSPLCNSTQMASATNLRN